MMAKKTQQIQQLVFPHDVITEKTIIGCLLLSSNAIYEVAQILNTDIFYTPKYATIYQAIDTLHKSSVRIDLLTVMHELERTGSLDEIGGSYELADLTTSISSSANISEYAFHLHELWLSRQLLQAGMEITAKSIDRTIDISDAIAESIKDIETVMEKTSFGSKWTDMSEASRNAVKEYEERKKAAQSGKNRGILTGLSRLDFFTGGWQPGQLIVLAARPAMGKTAMLLHFAKAAALQGRKVAIFSLEMGTVSLAQRVILSECNVSTEMLKAGKLSPHEEIEYCEAAGKISKLNIKIDETPTINIQQIKARCRNIKQKHGLDLVLIDYLQLMDVRSDNRSYNRENEVAQTSRAAKVMAKELEVPVILLSQINRNCESRDKKIPVMADLRESGAIEQDSDIIIFVHREEYYDSKAEKGLGVLSLAKQRDGRVGLISFRYNESLTQIYDTTNSKNNKTLQATQVKTDSTIESNDTLPF